LSRFALAIDAGIAADVPSVWRPAPHDGVAALDGQPVTKRRPPPRKWIDERESIGQKTNAVDGGA